MRLDGPDGGHYISAPFRPSVRSPEASGSRLPGLVKGAPRLAQRTLEVRTQRAELLFGLLVLNARLVPPSIELLLEPVQLRFRDLEKVVLLLGQKLRGRL